MRQTVCAHFLERELRYNLSCCFTHDFPFWIFEDKRPACYESSSALHRSPGHLSTHRCITEDAHPGRTIYYSRGSLGSRTNLAKGTSRSEFGPYKHNPWAIPIPICQKLASTAFWFLPWTHASFCLVCLLFCCFPEAVTGLFFPSLGLPDTHIRERIEMAQPDYSYRNSKGPWGARRCGPDARFLDATRAS